MRLITAPTDQNRPTVRESRRVRTVAEMLDADESQVRRLIAVGDLETHTIGKRGVRVYLDSVVAYQERQAAAPRKQKPKQTLALKRRAVSTAAHNEAVRNLRRVGVLP
jgi:hypothetical protein